VGLLFLESGVAPALIALAAIGVYVFIYTIWLKPRTPFAVIVGGISGAIAPLIADAAVTGHIGIVGWTLFAIIFVWQPPHFYAIALFRREDYARADFPMLPDRIGVDATVNRIVIWAVGLVGVTLLPFFWLGLGYLYLAVALVLGAICLQKAFRLRARKDDASARGFFLFSLIHLLGCFAAMILDLALGAWL
jgi:protoheme IX farnesyltransferase